ncbi:MAG TPA: AMP-binding protein, partial [Steroidobacteraceae bacterium]
MLAAARVGAMQPYSLTLERFIEHAARWHGATEVVTGGSGGARYRISYSALRDRSSCLSGALLSLGLAQGDNLAVMAWNTQSHLECWYGAMGVGIVCHTLNPRLAVTHLAGMIAQA